VGNLVETTRFYVLQLLFSNAAYVTGPCQIFWKLLHHVFFGRHHIFLFHSRGP